MLFLCILFAFGSIVQVNAQPGGLPGFDDTVTDEPPAPINGFIGIVLAVGAYFGAKKLKGKK